MNKAIKEMKTTRSQEIIKEIEEFVLNNSKRWAIENEANGIQFFTDGKKLFGKFDSNKEDDEYTFYKNMESFAKAIVSWEKRGY